MNQITFAIIAAVLLSIAPDSLAGLSEYEYKVGSAELAKEKTIES